jgi:hypothetical protein
VRRVVPAVLGAALAVPLLVYAAIGSYARYTADDYCWAGVLRTEGFFRAQMLWYTGYSPRYAFTFLVNLAELAGPAIVPILPAVAIGTWVATLTWTLWQFGVRLGARSRLTSAVLLAELIALATLQTAPDRPQSVYWQTGLLTYLLPLILATLLIGWIHRAVVEQRLGWGTVALSTAITFVAGGLSETYLIPQNVALTLALATALLLGRNRVGTVHLGAALAGGVLALLAIVVAPSTASRVDGTPADLWLASSAALATGGVQVLRLARFFPVVALLCILLPAALGQASTRVAPRWLWLSLAIALAAVPFAYFPSFYAQNGNPPARALIVPGAIFIAMLVFVGYALAQSRAIGIVPVGLRTALAIGLALVPLWIAASSLPDRALAAEQAARWDAEDQHIRASRDAGQLDVTVARLPRYLGEEFVSADRGNWFNVCVARYYGVRSIAAPG